MLKKTTGMALFVLMMAIITLQHPALKFCICHNTFMVSECPCEEVEAAPVAEHDSCGSCCGEQVAEVSSCEAKYTPGGCDVDLNLDVGEYLAFGSFAFQAEPNESEFVVPTFFDFSNLTPELVWATDRGGTEPPPKIVQQMPLFVRHSVFLI